mgnify:CR=1 FL=1
MIVIGLTGGIGTGKSTVAGFLRELGAHVVDLDRAGHEVIKSGTDVYNRLLKTFGTSIIGVDDEIDRSRLGQIVFSDARALDRLNAIVHPAIDEIVARTQEECRRLDVPVLVLEAAAMLENQRRWQADEIWITVAPEKTVLDRLACRSGYSEQQARARIRSQMTDAERRKLADVVIDTDCTLDELRNRVAIEWQHLLQRK